MTQEQLNILQEIFAQYPQISKVVLFGSRAMGNYRNGSDVDLALYGSDLKGPLFYIYDKLDEQLPFFADIIAYDSITNEKLKQHIDNVGKVIYGKTGEL